MYYLYKDCFTRAAGKLPDEIFSSGGSSREDLEIEENDGVRWGMKTTPISESILVSDLLARWPESIPVFLKFRMSCVGCSMARFETLSDAVGIYGLSMGNFMVELQQALENGPQKGP